MDDAATVQEAIKAAKGAYAPYSNFHVGAFVRMKSGRSLGAANIENASYGISICAETNAITSLISAGHELISSVTVVAYPASDPTARVLAAPCGRCRQFISEFADQDTTVIIGYADGEIGLKIKALDLLPHPFGPAALAINP